MSTDLVLTKLNEELRVNKLGDHRKFKFILMHLNDVNQTINFFIEILKYKRYQACKVAYNVQYSKIRYQKQFNRSQ